MTHVEIKTAAVEQKAAVARRFFVISIVEIDRPGADFVEEIILHLGRPNLRVAAQLFPAHQTTVFGLDANNPVQDLTSIDFAADRTYRTSGILAIPGYGYVFEMDGGDGFKRYGAVRVTHVGQTLLILDWAFQTDPGNPELIVTKK